MPKATKPNILVPTFAAVAGGTDVAARLRQGTSLAGHDYKVHLDGYNMLPLLTGETKQYPRPGWCFGLTFMLVPAQAIIVKFLETFAEFPPRQKAASFNLDGVLAKMTSAATGSVGG